MKDHITIIGGGIGGLTTALTLKQKGFQVTVYESTTELKPVGAGIILANNAMQVMQKLGLQEKLERAGNRISALKITDPNLKLLSVVDLTCFEQKYRVSNLAIHRGDLQKILAEEFGLENIIFSKRLAKLNKDTSCHLTFEDNTTLQASVIIGADGIKSVVRNQLFAENVIRKANQICWRGIGEIDLPPQYHHELNEAWGKGKRFGFVKISDRKVYWYALANTKPENIKRVDLSELFQDFHADIGAIIKTTGQNEIVTSDITDLLPIKKWQIGNVCLMGDAAHATTPNLGQGACQAIEDAYVLGKCLETETNVQTAFKNYEEIRRKKAHAVVNTSWQIGKLAHLENKYGVWFRNKLMQYMPQSANRKQLEMIFNLQY